jgi:undecaprenyl diphosphate synthase
MHFISKSNLHLAIIMDGNGRWASARGLPRLAGHRAGVDAARRIVESAPHLGVSTLTLYAFSSDNWRRPAAEVTALMRLFQEYLARETGRCIQDGVRLSVIGRRDRLPPKLVNRIEKTEAATIHGSRLHIRIALDYSGREAILSGQFGPDVDLLIRSGGEHRLSDFLLWESAYAELYFTARMWPEFDRPDLEAAIHEFHRRERRFGGLPAPLGQLGSSNVEQGNFHHLRGDRWLR